MVTIKTVDGARVVEFILRGERHVLPMRDARLLGLELVMITSGGESGYANYRSEVGGPCRGGCERCD